MSWHEYNIYSKTYTEGSDPFANGLKAFWNVFAAMSPWPALSEGDDRGVFGFVLQGFHKIRCLYHTL